MGIHPKFIQKNQKNPGKSGNPEERGNSGRRGIQNIQKMSTPRAYINPKQVRKNGRCTVYVMVHLDYKTVKFHTGVSCEPELWDEQAFRIRGSSQKVRDENLIIEQCLARLNDIFVRYRLLHTHLTPELLKNEWKNPARRIDFYAFFEEALQERRKELAPATVSQHKSSINILQGFRKELAFSEITPDFIVSFERWLKTKKKHKVNTVHSKMKVLRTYLNIAVRKGIISENPFLHVKVKRARANRIFLTAAELETMWQLYDSGVLEATKQKVLAHFLFMCFTGIRISDLKSLRRNNILSGMLVFTARKTRGIKQEVTRIPLSRYAKIIIENERNESDFLFITISEQKMNVYIKEIAKSVEINKEISNHSGRHTFATLWLAKTRDLAQLQSLLGHSNITDTMTYVHIQTSDLVERMQEFETDVFK